MIHEVNDILHHAFAGALVALLFGTPGKYRLYVLIGVVAALIPDVTKILFDSVLLHSLIAAPFVSVLGAGMGKAFLRKELFLRLFGAFLAAMVLGHQLLDIIDNGNELFFPLIREELEYSLISKGTPVVWITALAAMAAGWIFRRIRPFAVAGMAAILLFIGFQLVSKEMATNALIQRYPFPQATATVFPTGQWPWDEMGWSYQVRSPSILASGDIDAASGNIAQSIFYFTTPGEGLHYRVEEWTKTGGSFAITCVDERNGQIVRFVSSDGIQWQAAP
jgi:inner membrane protein